MKRLLFLVGLVVLSLINGCQQFDDYYDLVDNNKPSSKQLKIAVVSDLHYMAPSLLVKDGAAFQEYLARDPKLLAQSRTILETTIMMLLAQRPDIVLIPGDLTKDGEKVSHAEVIKLLDRLLAVGIKVYITPGNHDINNPDAKQFDGDIATSVPTVSAETFRSMYINFGFKNAIRKDPNSLSYIAQPSKNLWILSIDVNKYADNTTAPITGGAIKTETLIWVKQCLAEAKAKGITVIGMMHHNLLEHYAGQVGIDPGYVLDDWQEMSDELMNNGLKIIFTGHYHANDVVKKGTTGSKFLFDVETGSLLTYPCSYRMLTVKENDYSFCSYKVSKILGSEFESQSKLFLQAHLDGYFTYILKNVYGVPSPYAEGAAPLFRNGIMAHFAGDEALTPEEKANIDAFASISPDLAGVLYSFWTDINTPDNTLTINMSSGQVK